MRNIVILVLTIFTSCAAYKDVPTIEAKHQASIELLQSKKKLFLRDTPYYKYTGNIVEDRHEEISTFTYKYNSNDLQIQISTKYYPEYLPLFRNGILHPKYIWGLKHRMSIGQFEERKHPNDITKRSYKCWVGYEDSVNFCKYDLDLINENATLETSTENFLKDSSILYISPCSLVI